MSKTTGSEANVDVATVGQALVEAAGTDTVYADVYLQRARELLGRVLSPQQYSALLGIERGIDDVLKQTRAATLLQDWARVDALAGQVEALRRRVAENAALRELGDAVYAPGAVNIDPFSPGLEALAGNAQDQAEVRDALVDRLKRLARIDPERAAFYESRCAFFAGLGLVSTRRGAAATAAPAVAGPQLERLAAQAAQQGDIAQLRRYAQELLARRVPQAAVAQAAPSEAPGVPERATYQCPIDLAAPFPEAAVARAPALGLTVAVAAPLPQAVRLLDYIVAHIWQPNLSGTQSEHEGAMRIAGVVDEAGLPAEASEPVKILIGQFLRNPFINSGGARYLPPLGAEAVLIEDFPEDHEPPASELLSALGLERRVALSRIEIDDALRAHGAAILADRLGLDPIEFRLVCIPHDLYMRCGRERGWGQQQQWTHFDGYQVLKKGALRALVGGDVRHGGLSDLLSIARTDQRECVVARLAVIRRARHVARWH
jgi:hypothetical protein